MPAKPTLAKFDALVKKVARLVAKHAKANVSEKWKSAYVDMRTSGDGSCIYKFRVELPNGTLLKQIDTPDGLGELFVSLLAMRSELFEPVWFGVKITTVPNGQSKTDYNHDPDYVNDPNFFDSDE